MLRRGVYLGIEGPDEAIVTGDPALHVLGEVLYLVLVGEVGAIVLVDVAEDLGESGDVLGRGLTSTNLRDGFEFPTVLYEPDIAFGCLLYPVGVHVDILSDLDGQLLLRYRQLPQEEPGELVELLKLGVREGQDLR